MEVSLSPRARVVVLWIAAIAGGFLLLQTAHALRPFVWAVVTAYILHPLVSATHRRTRLPKQLITAWLYAMLGLILAILVINLVPRLLDQVKQLQDRIPTAVDETRIWIESRQGGTLDRLGINADFVSQRLNALASDLTKLLGTAALPLVLTTFSYAVELLIYLVASFYFIVQGDRFVLAIRDALNRRYHNEFDRLMLEINTTLGAYVRGQLLLIAIMSVASYIALSILHIDYALSLAIATGFLELIPLVGPVTAAGFAILISLFQSTTPYGWSHPTLAIVVGLAYFALRQLEDSFVVPLVIGRIVHIHPLLVIFCLVVGTSLGGVLGLILAVPMAAVLRIVVAFFYAKIMARQTRRVEPVSDRHDLERLLDEFPGLLNATLVLLIEPATLGWSDLPLAERIAEAAEEHAIDLSVVTTDPIAGALFTAAGIPTATIPATAPAHIEALGVRR